MKEGTEEYKNQESHLFLISLRGMQEARASFSHQKEWNRNRESIGKKMRTMEKGKTPCRNEKRSVADKIGRPSKRRLDGERFPSKGGN